MKEYSIEEKIRAQDLNALSADIPDDIKFMAKVEYKYCEKCNNTWQSYVNGKCKECFFQEEMDRIFKFNSLTLFEKCDSIKRRLEESHLSVKELNFNRSIKLTVKGITLSFNSDSEEFLSLFEQMIDQLDISANTAIHNLIFPQPTYAKKV